MGKALRTERQQTKIIIIRLRSTVKHANTLHSRMYKY